MVYPVFSAYLTMLERAMLKAAKRLVRPSICLSVCPSQSWATPKWFKISKRILHRTIEPCFNFLGPNFIVVSLGVCPEWVCQRDVGLPPLSKAKIWPITCNRPNVETVRDRIHMGFRLVLKSVTLNDLERHNRSYFSLFYRIRQLWGQLR